MSGIDETIVREYFELNGFLVRQLRKYQVQSRAKRTEEEIDLIVYNPSWRTSSRKPNFMLFANELPLIRRAVVFVKPWHSQRFSPGTLRGSADISKFLETDVLKSAEQLFNVADDILSAPDGQQPPAGERDTADTPSAARESADNTATHLDDTAHPDGTAAANEQADTPPDEGPLTRILVLPGLPTHEPHKTESIRLLQNAGLDAIISFRSMLQDLLGKVEINHNYSKSDFLQTLRLLKNYDMVKSPQMELFKSLK